MDGHWDAIWSGDDGSGRSWHRADAGPSLRLIRDVAPPGGSVIDVGGGSSRLVDALLDVGHARPTVVDIADAALEHSRRRLGSRASEVDWVAADVTRLDLGRAFDVWHDRAVLHFLTDAADQQRYVEVARAHLAIGGHAVIATFSLDGPDRCSGLPVQQYDAAGLADLFGDDFTLVHDEVEHHTTPSGASQEFTWVALRRTH